MKVVKTSSVMQAVLILTIAVVWVAAVSSEKVWPLAPILKENARDAVQDEYIVVLKVCGCCLGEMGR